MKVKMILPALTEAKSDYFRPIKYSLFPPLGLATLAGYLSEADEVEIQDEHVEQLQLNDSPDLVVIQAYITSAYRAYELADHYRARGAHVCLGGLHTTALPQEAARHADTIFLGPGEDTWPRFLKDFRDGSSQGIYISQQRSLEQLPPTRRDLIKRENYLVPNSIVVSRGCPHHCDFCYKDSFYKGGKSFYTMTVDAALHEISLLAGKHLFFLDDNIFADARFAESLFAGMQDMGRIWQAAGTVQALMNPSLLDKAVKSGLRSLFVGFETLIEDNLRDQNKVQNLNKDYTKAIRELHDRGVMINASFVFGMDHDDETVFQRTVEWAVENGIETATFHILTPYPGTALYDRFKDHGRIKTDNWNLYDTRHAVFQPAQMSAARLEEGYWHAYDEFYRWSNILEAAMTKSAVLPMIRHLAYTGGWKKFEPLWGAIIQLGLVGKMRPLLERVLSGRGQQETGNRLLSPEAMVNKNTLAASTF